MLIVLTGKTASGKDTISRKLLTLFPDLKKVLTTTSRNPRPGEKNGVDYKFLSRGQFEEKINSNQLLEYVEYGGNLYGTEKSELEKNRQSDLIWRIDPSRAAKVRDLVKERVIVIYINVPDSVALERLKKRGLPDMEVAKRMLDDKKIWQQHKDSYDFVVENVTGELNDTVDKIIDILKNHA